MPSFIKDEMKKKDEQKFDEMQQEIEETETAEAAEGENDAEVQPEAAQESETDELQQQITKLTADLKEKEERALRLQADFENFRRRTSKEKEELSALIIAAQQGHEITEADQERLKLDDEQEQEFKKALLGDAYDLMVADGVSWEAMKIVTATVMRWVVADRAAAEEFWESQMVAAPKSKTRAQKRAPSAKPTKKPASRAGTTKTPAK